MSETTTIIPQGTKISEMQEYSGVLDPCYVPIVVSGVNKKLSVAVLASKVDLEGKIDAEAGKGLSANDYTAEDKTKVGAAPSSWVQFDDTTYALAVDLQAALGRINILEAKVDQLMNAEPADGPIEFRDGSTLGWYRPKKADTVTTGSNNKFVSIKDFLNAGPDFVTVLNNLGFNPTVENGAILLSGDGPRFWGDMVLQQPWELYMMATVYSDTNNVMLGTKQTSSTDGLSLYFNDPASPVLVLEAADHANLVNYNAMPYNSPVLFEIVADNANSILGINDTTGTVGDGGHLGINVNGSLIIGNNYSDNGNGNTAHMLVHEWFIRTKSDTDAVRTKFRNYLKTQYPA